MTDGDGQVYRFYIIPFTVTFLDLIYFVSGTV